MDDDDRPTDTTEAILAIAAVAEAEDSYKAAAILFADDWVGAADAVIVAVEMLKTVTGHDGPTIAMGLRKGLFGGATEGTPPGAADTETEGILDPPEPA
jgi:hypothetical protein